MVDRRHRVVFLVRLVMFLMIIPLVVPPLLFVIIRLIMFIICILNVIRTISIFSVNKRIIITGPALPRNETIRQQKVAEGSRKEQQNK